MFMDIFYLNSKNFLQFIDEEFIKQFKKKELGSKKRIIEHSMSMFILEYLLKRFYKIENFEIVYENKKPKLKNDEIYFNISHSKDIILIAFNDSSVGVDIEQKKERDFKKLSDYYNVQFKNKEDFYEFWTKLEAGIKLQKPVIDTITRDFIKGCKLSIASVEIIEKLNLYQIKAIEKIDTNDIIKNNNNSIIIVKKSI